MTRTARTLATALVAVGVGLLIACSSPEKELQQAKAAGTTAALDAFLARHPQGPLADEARTAKEKIELDAAKAVGTEAAFEDFLKRHPQGPQADAARDAIEGIHFTVAQGLGTFEGYERFLARHPQGKKVAAARQAMDALLPEFPVVSNVDVVSTEAARCTVHSRVTILHRAGGFGSEPPPLVAGTMNCGGMIGASSIELEQMIQDDPNRTTVLVKSASAAGWGECGSGTCSVRFTVLGQDRVVTARYQ